MERKMGEGTGCLQSTLSGQSPVSLDRLETRRQYQPTLEHQINRFSTWREGPPQEEGKMLLSIHICEPMS